jgi:hypothetical protein
VEDTASESRITQENVAGIGDTRLSPRAITTGGITISVLYLASNTGIQMRINTLLT